MRVNKLFQQPIYNGITLIIQKVSAVKNRYYIKNTAAAGLGKQCLFHAPTAERSLVKQSLSIAGIIRNV